MSRYCLVCAHEQREAIDLALLRHQASYRALARAYGLDDSALQRHQRNHLALTWARAKELNAMLSAEHLLERLADLDARALRGLDAAEQQGEWRLVFAGIREARATVEAYGHLTAVSQFEQRLSALEAQQGGDHHGKDHPSLPGAPDAP